MAGRARRSCAGSVGAAAAADGGCYLLGTVSLGVGSRVHGGEGNWARKGKERRGAEARRGGVLTLTGDGRWVWEGDDTSDDRQLDAHTRRRNGPSRVRRPACMWLGPQSVGCMPVWPENLLA